MTQLIGLFPTPLLRIEGFVADAQIAALDARAQQIQRHDNSGSGSLTHTEMLEPGSDALFAEIVERAQPHLVQFGTLLFASELQWTVKEMWLNVLETGGSQFLHTHANSFVSGIVYLRQPEGAARTMFRKPASGGEFIFRNDVPPGHYSAETWTMDKVQAGDLVLYPSHLLHGVPPNEGGQRITLAFNAIPDQLDSLGYKIRFAP